MRKTILLLSLTCLSVLMTATRVFSQNDEKGTLIGDPGDTESARNIVADNTGNTFVAGKKNRNGLIVKQTPVHTTIWSKSLSFTTNPADEVTILFFDLLADTVFGCGKIHQFNQEKGTFYFKMNAQTGAMYWSKFETASQGYLSCMRYANGKFFLIGSTRASGIVNGFSGKVMAVSSQTGNVIWQTPLLRYTLPNTINPSNWTFFSDATEMVNGKLFITGFCLATFSASVSSSEIPILIGIDEMGTVFMEKFLSLPIQTGGILQMSGRRIHRDMDQNLVLASYFDPVSTYNFNANVFLTKCDTLGQIIFQKAYNVDYLSLAFVDAMNETASDYVLFGTLYGNFSGSYVLKADKNGNFQKCIGIYKPNVYPDNFSNVTESESGNSAFVNGTHYFVSSEGTGTIPQTDINQIILDEQLNTIEDCSEVFEIAVPELTIPTTIDPLIAAYVVYPLSFQNGFILDDVPAYTYCDNVSLDLVQNQGCSQTVLQANIAGFIDPVFYWSTGDTTSVNTLPVNTTDTVFLRVLDTKCCELIDTIVPSIVPSSFSMSLPADTIVCLQPGNSFILTPTFSGANTPVQYLWSTNSTGTSLAVTSSGTYWVELSDSCLTLRDSIVITVNSLPVIGNTANVVVCEDDFPTTLNPTVSAGATILWDDGTTTPNRTVTGPGSYTISATNTCGTVNALIAVSQTNLPDVQLTALVDTCLPSGGSIVLIPIFSDVNTIAWSDGSSGNQLVVSSTGSYTVYGSNVCGIDSASCSVTINYFPELDLPAALDTCFDIGVGFSYTAQGSPGSYQWSSGSQTATEWISQEGTYSCTLTNVCGSITDSMQVRRLTAVDLYFPEDSIRDCQKQLSVSLLHIETNYNLELFAPDGGLVGTHLSESGWYDIHAYNACGEKWDSIYVNLQNEQFFYLPNSFTPNGDEHNDRFEFKGENIAVRDVRIFNRWGEEVFTESGNFTGWDGKYQGQICPDGVYAIHVIYTDCFGMPAEFNGHVNLIR